MNKKITMGQFFFILGWALLLLVACFIGMIQLLEEWEDENEFTDQDKLVYMFIAAKVEADDDLLAQILDPSAHGILKPGRHEYPGAAQAMGERYEIIRYSNEYENGYLFYKVRFYRPNTELINDYNVMMAKTEVGWRIVENGSIDDYIMEAGRKDEKGTIVHAYPK